MKQIRLYLTVMLFFVANLVFAQKITVTGVVTDAGDGSPLIGAGVIVKGSTNGAATDINGAFTLTVDSKDVLVVSYVGYLDKEVAVNGQKVINVQLQSDAEMLEETIVVGYGTAKKISSVVGAATTVKQKVFENRPVASAGDALQGQVAGLQVFTSSGEPSATVSMRLRGVNSINASNSPLFILDGSPVSSSVFTTLNSNDIANITVLKDASSTAIYGSRAANGVVYITTKKGASEKPIIKLSAQYGMSNLVRDMSNGVMNSEQYFQFREMADPSLKNNAQFQELKNFRLSNNINFDWKNWILNKNAPTVSADLSVSGRSQMSDYYISFGMFDQEGIEPYSSLTRYNVRSNINTKLTSWLKMGINLALTYQETETAGYSGTGNSWYNPMNIANWSLPYTTPYEILTGPNGEFLGYNPELPNYFSDMGLYNYFYLMGLQPSGNNYVRLNGNTYQEISPIKGLTIRAAQALEGYDYRSSGKVLPSVENLLTTRVSENFTRFYRMTSTNTIEYKFNIKDNHNFVVLAGHESIIDKSESFGASMTGYTDVRLMTLSKGTTEQKPSYSFAETSYNSFFGRLSYDFNEKYFVDATYRKDGSSLFGVNKRYADFYSVGAMWNIKRENFMKDVDWLNKLQLKASYGTTGNSGISNYLSNGLVGTSTLYDGKQTWGISQVSNPDLTWETIESLNIGVNARVLDLLDVEVEFYNKLTKDMLMEIPYSYSTGFSGGWGNVGNMRNRGIDLTIGADVINTKDILFNVTANFNYNKNEIIKLFGGRDEFEVPNTGMKYKVGEALGDYYYVKYAGVDPATGNALYYDLDGNVTPNYSASYAQFIRKYRFAPYAAGLQLDFAWKGLSVSAAFSGVFGKWLHNNDKFFLENHTFAAESNISTTLLDMWTEPGQVTSIPGAHTSPQVSCDRWVENASFVRLKNVQVGYSFPKAWMNKTGFLSGLKVYATGRNLLTFTKYTGYDPEVDSYVSMGRYPNSKQITFGLELTF